MASNVRRGQVWLTAFDPTVGSEVRKARPALIVSPDEMLARLRTAIVIPMTTGSTAAPFRLDLTYEGRQARLLLDQMRAIDRTRLFKRLPDIEPAVLSRALQLLVETFEL